MRSHVLIFEPDANGHQMEYLRYLLESMTLRLTGFSATLVTSAAAVQHPNCRRLIEDYQRILRVVTPPAVTKRHWFFRRIDRFYERQWRHSKLLERGMVAVGADQVDFILVPSLDSIGLLHIGLRPRMFGGKPWATIAIGLQFHHRQAGIAGPVEWQDTVQGVFFRKVVATRSLVCLGSVNPFLAEVTGHRKVVSCPEPASAPVLADRTVARRVYGVRADTCVILVFGVIDRRKCVDVLLEGVSRVDPALDVTVLLVGSQNRKDVAAALGGDTAGRLRGQGRLVEHDRFIVIGQDIDPMSVADVSWVFYDRSFVRNSNVLIRSALARVPVICRDQGVVGRGVNESRCGMALPSDAPDAIAAAITRLATDPELRQAMGECGASYFAHHTPKAFAEPIVARMAEFLESRQR